MIDIYGKEMYNLLHEGTHQAKAELPLHEPVKTSPGSRFALHCNVKDRSGKDEAYRVSRYAHCQSPALSNRQAVGRGSRRLTYPLYTPDKNRLSHITHPLHNIPYATRPLNSRGGHQDNTSCNFCVFSCLKKGGISLGLVTELMPRIKYQKRYKT